MKEKNRKEDIIKMKENKLKIPIGVKEYCEQNRIYAVIEGLEVIHKNDDRLDKPLEQHICGRLYSKSSNIMESEMFKQINNSYFIRVGDVIFMGEDIGWGMIYAVSETAIYAKYYHVYIATHDKDGLYRIGSLIIDEDNVIHSNVYRIVPLNEIKNGISDEYETFSLKSIVKLTEKSRITISQNQINEIEKGIKDTAKSGGSQYNITKYSEYRDDIREHFEKLGFTFVKEEEGMLLTPRYYIRWEVDKS